MRRCRHCSCPESFQRTILPFAEESNTGGGFSIRGAPLLARTKKTWFASCSGSPKHVRLSLIIPAYNEEGRLGAFLDDLARCQSRFGYFLQEILVVDDGSTDHTAALTETHARRLPLTILRLPTNRGKGAAVRTGIFAATSEAVVFMDADGATPPDALAAMSHALEAFPIVVGNRWIVGSTVSDREPLRALSGWVYRTYVGLFGLRGIDTMCGFKGFHRQVARSLFVSLLHERWLFDTEVMLRARHHKIPIGSVPISWTSKHGSKLQPSVLAKALFEIPFLAWKVARERRLAGTATT